MPWLALNGINVGAIAAVGDPPKSGRRDIGAKGPAGDGSLRVTRQTRKRDLSFTSVPLTSSVALAWEGLITGEGESWSFESSEYGSKGTGPAAGGVYSVPIGGGKFGNCLRLPATTGLIQYPKTLLNSAGALMGWTVMVWRNEAPYRHYIVRSDGAKFLNGVSSGIATAWLTAASAPVSDGVQLTNTGGAAVDYDDLVILPYAIPDTWAAVFGTATSAFSALPYVNATGDLVNEQATRRVLGSVEETVMRATAGGLRLADMKKLSVELEAA